MPNLLLCSDAFKISLNGKEAYFTNHLNLQMTQRFYYPQIPLNKECYIKLTVRSNVYLKNWNFVGRFGLFSYGDVATLSLGMPGKGVQTYKNEFFHTPRTQVGLEGALYSVHSPSDLGAYMYNDSTSYFSCDFEVFYN